jgi:acyl-CoA dehydrogenase
VDHLDWPFFDDDHRRFAAGLAGWADTNLSAIDHDDPAAACRSLVKALGDGGWLDACVPAQDGGLAPLDARAICLGRETLAQREPLADFAFAMQGLGSGPISLFGSDALRARYLPGVRAGEAIAAFALSETGAGSDAAALATRATADGAAYIIDGEKTWISNGGIADFYVVFARTGEGEGSRGISAFVVDAETTGLDASRRIESIAPHPLATIRFDACRVPKDRLIGRLGEGFKVAMGTLDVFRAGVAAAALGFARRALREALAHAKQRELFGRRLADLQLTQAALADMATANDASALLTYRAAWVHDRDGTATREVAMAKMFATESAQRVVDRAVQIFGALGVMHGHIAERLYREVRALRIYEGATEIQQLVVARELLGPRPQSPPVAGTT